jgi:hypothetical protein
MLNYCFSGISDGACEVPAAWHGIAAANSRTLEEDRTTKKSLGSSSQTQIQDRCSSKMDATATAP